MSLASSVIRVGSGPRGTVFDPTVVAGLYQWIDFSTANSTYTDAGTTKVVNDGDAIYQSNDKTATAAHFIQATSGNRPLWKKAIQNSLAVARFDGTDDWLAATVVGDWTITVFIVMKKRSAQGSSDSFGLRLAQNSLLTGNQNPNSNNWNWKYNNSGTSSSSGIPTQSFQIAVIRVNSTSSADFYGSGGTATNIDPYDAANGLGDSTATQLGADASGGNASDVDIGEFLRYDSALTAANINTIGSGLGTKWNLTWTNVS
jgi:hypothetical protein